MNGCRRGWGGSCLVGRNCQRDHNALLGKSWLSRFIEICFSSDLPHYCSQGHISALWLLTPAHGMLMFKAAATPGPKLYVMRFHDESVSSEIEEFMHWIYSRRFVPQIKNNGQDLATSWTVGILYFSKSTCRTILHCCFIAVLVSLCGLMHHILVSLWFHKFLIKILLIFVSA